MPYGSEYPYGPDEGGLGQALLPVAAVALLLVGFTLITIFTPNSGGQIVDNRASASATVTQQSRATFQVDLGSTSPDQAATLTALSLFAPLNNDSVNDGAEQATTTTPVSEGGDGDRSGMTLQVTVTEPGE